MSLEWLAAYLVLGAFVGFFAGLLGVGGGGIMVPVLTGMFSAQRFPEEHVVHLALGTSMGAIVLTSVASLRAHHARGAVRWEIVRRMTPGIVLGTLVGTAFASRIAALPLAIFFVCFMGYVSLQMLLNVKPTPSRQLPGALGLCGVGTFIGWISALVAIGGGSLSVPFMTWCNVRIQHAIGTSSALGLPISLAGAAGYTISGWAIADLPEHHVGYVYLPALLCIALVSTLTAPLGAKLAHRLPVSVLKKVFAGVLMLLAAKMLHTVVAGRAVPPGGEQVSQNAHRASRSSWTQARLGFVATWTDLGLWKLTCRQNEDGGRNPPPIVVARTFTVLDRPPHPGGVGVFPSRDRF